MEKFSENGYCNGNILVHEDGTNKVFFIFKGRAGSLYDVSYFPSNVICTVREDGSYHFKYLEKCDKLELDFNEVRKPDGAELRKFLGILRSNGYAYDGKEVFNMYDEVQKRLHNEKI